MTVPGFAEDPTVEAPSDEQLPTIAAFVSIAGEELGPDAQDLLVRVVVDNKLNLPGMVELTFRDLDGTVLAEAGITIGTQISVSGTSIDGTNANLIVAEVTAIEGSMSGMTTYTTVRGYTALHRLHRARHSKTYLNTTDSDLAVEIARLAGLTCGSIVESATTHAYLAQVNQTDAEFLTERAIEIGYELGMTAGQFFFRPASTVTAPAVAGVPPQLVFRENLTSFRARVSAGNLTPDVEVRVWDPMMVSAYAAPGTTPTGGPFAPNTLGTEFEEKPAGVAGALGAGADRVLGDVSRGLADLGQVTADIGEVTSIASSADQLLGGRGTELGGLGEGLGGMEGGLGGLLGGAGSPLGANALGPVPSPTAHIIVDRPLADSTSVHTSGAGAATALGNELGVTAAEAEGDALGDPLIQPGALVQVSNVHAAIAGNWLISHVQHIFDDREYGYHTSFSAHGREDRSVLGLTSRALTDRRRKIEGVVCGVVSNVLDPLGRARVKVVLPWLSPDFETDWAPVGQFCAGPRTGALFVPDVGNEVLLVFEFGDPRRPYVVGSLVNNQSAWSLDSGAGPMAALAALAGGLGGAGGQLAGLATDVEGIASTIAALTPAGQLIHETGAGGPLMSGGAVNGSFSMTASQVGGLLLDTSGVGLAANSSGDLDLPSAGPTAGGSGQGGMVPGAMGAVQQSPGMVGEVVRSGLVTSTGNALLFNDQPMPGMAGGAGADGAAAGGLLSEAGGLHGGKAGAAAGVAGEVADGPPLASSITLGAQGGNHGIYIDQVSSMVIMQANATPGVSMSETPMLVITTGPTGNVVINGGESLTLASDTLITMVAPEIMIGGETITVVGEVVPLTPG